MNKDSPEKIEIDMVTETKSMLDDLVHTTQYTACIVYRSLFSKLDACLLFQSGRDGGKTIIANLTGMVHRN